LPDNILVAVAWPYANGSLHAGQFAGAYLPADIFARYHRAAGNRVLMVSGSDSHGTPITVRAEREGRAPEEVFHHFHDEFLESWRQLGISFDLFTSTDTENHARVAQDMFLRLLEQGHIYKHTMPLPYCEVDRRFLPDRFVEGNCPNCGYEYARGDQCDNCGRQLDPTDLLNPHCRICGSVPVIRDSEHFFLRLSAFNEALTSWVSSKEGWRKNVSNFTLGILREGLKDRAITRDIQWGVPIPLEGYDEKRIYVWFEAVIGYLSASIEWALSQGEPDVWKDWWQGDAQSYYFIGKDNIPFHTIIWPAVLMGYGGLNLPYDVPANQYVNIYGSKASTSRNWAPFLPNLLERWQPDQLRYYLSAIMPETSDSDFTFDDFVRRTNDELVATWGNLVHRVLSFTHSRFDGAVPEPGELTERDNEMLELTAWTLEETGRQLAACSFRAALATAMSTAQAANRYLDETAPWKAIKDDPQAAGRALWTAINVIAGLNVCFYPFLPFGAEKLHCLLGGKEGVAAAGWKAPLVPAGLPFEKPAPLFQKVDPEEAEAERSRLGT
jgi:methionyl-tRNA synthetase